MTPTRAALPNARWHFQHGPIDLIIGADGDPDAIAAAHDAAWARFQTVLTELVVELPLLREPVRERCPLHGLIARRMWDACAPYRDTYITPMAAVAGAVAQELIAAYDRAGVQRAWINNGGDIALHLAPGTSVKVGLLADLARFDPRDGNVHIDADFEITATSAVRGIATSGWRGRSFSLGIADSVTVLARSAAHADAAATVIANAVDVGDARIQRRPANALKDDTDLGAIPVTVDVPRLPRSIVEQALSAGERRARELLRDGLIERALLVCQDRWIGVEAAPPATPLSPPQPR